MKKLFVYTFCILLTAAAFAQPQKSTISKEDLTRMKELKSELMLEKRFVEYDQFTADEMTGNLKRFGADNGWMALEKEMMGKNFKRINSDKASWGFKGTMLDENGMKHNVVFCAYDYYNPKEKAGQASSMIWRKVDDKVYKAYIVFPAGEKDGAKALANSEEWFADDNGKVQKAHSWNKCFTKCIEGGKHKVKIDGIGSVTANCKNSCLASVAVCAAATGAIALATGGLTIPWAVGIFGVCAGVGCGQCLAMCALGCS